MLIQTYRDDRFFFVFNLLFWTSLSLFTFIKAGLSISASGQEVYWGHIFSFTFTSGVLWAVFSVLINRIVHQYPIAQKRVFNFVITHLIMAIGISASQRFISMSLDYFIQTTFKLVPEFPSYSNYFGSYYTSRFFEGLLWYFLIAAILYGYQYYKLYVQSQKQNAAISESRTDTAAQIKIKTESGLYDILIEEILFIQSDKNYCIIHTEKRNYRVRSTLKTYESKFENTDIKRIHKSFLVNTRHLLNIKHLRNGEYIFSLKGSKKRITSSITYRETAKNIIQKFKG